MEVGLELDISGELNLPAKPSLEEPAAAFSFSKKLSNLQVINR